MEILRCQKCHDQFPDNELYTIFTPDDKPYIIRPYCRYCVMLVIFQISTMSANAPFIPESFPTGIELY